MSYTALLSQRCDIQRLDVTDVDGAPLYTWLMVKQNVPCRVDLSYVPPGEQQGWIPEAGRADDRAGTAFFGPRVDIRPGDRIVLVRGYDGTYEVKGNLNVVIGRQGKAHHIEVRVEEVAKALGETS